MAAETRSEHYWCITNFKDNEMFKTVAMNQSSSCIAFIPDILQNARSTLEIMKQNGDEFPRCELGFAVGGPLLNRIIV